MRKYVAALVVVLMLALSPRAPGQRGASTTLVVRVMPEARIDPSRIALEFRVADTVVQTVNVAAWVRSLPNQQIRVSARLEKLEGPNGPVPVTAVSWTGAVAHATAGGNQARCTSDAFAAGQSQDLTLGWRQSGTLTCTFAFRLAESNNLAPGLYSGTVDLSVTTQ
jgi:hypothetical protein